MLALSLCLAAPVLAAPDVLIFDDGQLHFLNQNNVNPDDDVIVRGATSGQRTLVRFVDQAVVRNVTAEAYGWVQTFGSTRITGTLLVEGDGEAFLDHSTSVEGDTIVGDFGELAQNADATLGSITVGAGAEIRLSGTVAGSVDSASTTSLIGDFLGSVTLRGAGDSLVFGARVDGGIEVLENARLRTFDSNFQGAFTVRDSGFVQLRRASLFSGPIVLEDTASLRINAQEINVPFGDVAGPSGVLIGLDEDGEPFSIAFLREPATEIEVVRIFTFFGESVCSQDEPNSLGLTAALQMTGSQRASDDDLILRANGIPVGSFGYFVVGDSLVDMPTAAGRLCVGGNIGRYVGPGEVQAASEFTAIEINASIQPIPGNPPTFAATGQTFYFQAWYRDVDDMGMPTSRLSVGRSVTFL